VLRIHEHAIEMQQPTPGEQTNEIPPTVKTTTHRVSPPNINTSSIPRNTSFNHSPRSEDAEEARIGLLLSAAQRDSVDRVLNLLESGVNVNACDYDRRTALHVACSDGSANVVQVLIEEGADINAKDRFHHTPLDDAVSNGHGEIAERLRYLQASHGSMNSLEGQLIAAAADNNIGDCHHLLNNGVNPNCSDYDRRTPLHLAVSEGHTEIAKLLLEFKANPHAEDRWGSTPLSELQRRLTRTGDDPMQDIFKEYLTSQNEVAPLYSKFAIFYGFWEIVFICLWGGFMKYGEDSHGGDLVNDVDKEREFALIYPLYQDVHVMIFIGFGFLMVFLRKHGYTSVGVTFLVAAFVLQEYQLVRGFWEQFFSFSWNYPVIDIESIVMGDFCAGAVLITFGVVLGKVSPSQMLLLALVETVFYALNERIGFLLQVADLGGSMTIHLFGAVFGVAASLMLTPKSARGNQNNAAVYHSDIMALIGTIFLYMFWPSFNAALAVGTAKPRAVINTLYSISASTVVAFLASYTFRRERKFNMVDIQNATIAGGVAMGACCTMLIFPASAMAIGAVAGLVSVLGYVYVQPLLERLIGLHDTCGVWNLHGMPSLIGGVASVIAAACANDSYYSSNDFLAVFGEDRATGRRAAPYQALMQFIYMLTTIGIGLAAGFCSGLIARLAFFEPPSADNTNSVFQDDQWWEVPHLELPYYFDARGEISRGAANLNDTDAHVKHINSTAVVGAEDLKGKARYQRQLEAKLDALEQQLNIMKKQQRANFNNNNNNNTNSNMHYNHRIDGMRGMNGNTGINHPNQSLTPAMNGMIPQQQQQQQPSLPPTFASPMPPMQSMPYSLPPNGYGMNMNMPYYGYQQQPQPSDSSARLELMLSRLLTKLDGGQHSKDA